MATWRLVGGSWVDIDFTGTRLVNGTWLEGEPTVPVLITARTVMTPDGDVITFNIVDQTVMTPSGAVINADIAAAPASVTAAITGTATASITEADIVAGGKTVIITLTGDTWIAAGTGPIGTTAQSLAICQSLDSAQAEATGWDAKVKANFVATDIVRTSDTVATITIGAESAYDITAQETITVGDIANAVLTTSGTDITPSNNTFTVDIVSGVTIPIFRYHYMVMQR